MRDVSLNVREGELLVLLGESGSGKTTTLKMINRLIEPSPGSGSIEIDGDSVTNIPAFELRRSIGYVFQDVGLFPHMTVGENIAIVPRLLNWPQAESAARTDELLDLVKLAPEQFRDRMPDQLSGGQQQRIGLARALAARPQIMLMDEPFGALDPLTRAALQDEFVEIHRALDLTTVMVTHDMTEALLLADRIAIMYQGGILQIGAPPELLAGPANEYVRRLVDMPRRQAYRLESLVHEASDLDEKAAP